MSGWLLAHPDHAEFVQGLGVGEQAAFGQEVVQLLASWVRSLYDTEDVGPIDHNAVAELGPQARADLLFIVTKEQYVKLESLFSCVGEVRYRRWLYEGIEVDELHFRVSVAVAGVDVRPFQLRMSRVEPIQRLIEHVLDGVCTRVPNLARAELDVMDAQNNVTLNAESKVFVAHSFPMTSNSLEVRLRATATRKPLLQCGVSVPSGPLYPFGGGGARHPAQPPPLTAYGLSSSFSSSSPLLSSMPSLISNFDLSTGTHVSVKSPATPPAPPPALTVTYPSCYVPSSSSLHVSPTPPVAGLCGFVNAGSTCYLNAALQCLVHCDVFRSLFLARAWVERVDSHNVDSGADLLSYEMALLVQRVWRPLPIPPVLRFAALLRLVNRPDAFAPNTQHDCHEVLTYLLDQLHEELKAAAPGPSLMPIPRIEGVTDAETAAQVWEAHRQRGSVVVDNFHGLLRSKLQCPDCGATSVKFDPYITLGLPIPSAPAKRRKVFVARLPEGSESIGLHHHIAETPFGMTVGELCAMVVRKLPGSRDKHDFVAFALQELPAGYGLGPLLSWSSYVDAFDFNVPIAFYDVAQSLRMLRDDGDGGIVMDDAFDGSAVGGVDGVGVGSATAHGAGAASGGAANFLHCFEVVIRHLRFRENGSVSALLEVFGFPLVLRLAVGVSVHAAVMEAVALQTATWMRPPQPSVPVPSASLLRSSYGSPSFAEDSRLHYGSDLDDVGDEAQPPTSLSGSQQWVLQEALADRKLLLSERRTGRALERVLVDCTWSAHQFYARYVGVASHPLVPGEPSEAPPPAPEPTTTLIECLERMQQPERLSRSDMWNCKNCKEPKEALKEISVWSLPPVLVVYFKRFEMIGTLRRKLETRVTFPVTELLDLGDCVAGPVGDEGACYELVSVVKHSGTLQAGHYVACVKVDDVGWHEFNDTAVHRVHDIHKALSGTAPYVLFFRRVSSAATASSAAPAMETPAKRTRTAEIVIDVD